MNCLPDFADCHYDSSLGNCCSTVCVQFEGQPKGYCGETKPKETTSSPSPTNNTTSTTPKASSSCIKEGQKCQPDGSLGNCCSVNCNKQAHQGFGTCVGSSPPTNVPESCPQLDERCRTDGSLGFCCGDLYCKVLFPQTIGTCRPDPTKPTGNNSTDNMSSNSSNSSGLSTSAIIFTSLGLVTVIGLFIGIILIYWRQRKINKILSNREARLFFEGDPESMHLNGYAHECTDNMPYDKELEILETDFNIDWENPLGQGCYGVVLKGKIKNAVTVAAKTLRSNNPETGTYLRALLCEIKVLQHIGKAEHIVSMIGCHTSKLRNGKVFLFLEFCPLGSLEKFLRANKYDFMHTQSGESGTYVNLPANGDEKPGTTSPQMTSNDLLMWSMQITDAMIYLMERKVIHADLATRNVLLLRKDCAKVTDFGLSRRLYEYGNYVKKNQEPLPWRWMALESLQQLTFSHQSDVWSLAITIWEIYSLGDVPYPGLSWTPGFVADILENSLRPTKPATASEKLYAIMLDCWKPIPDARPSFREIYNRLYELK